MKTEEAIRESIESIDTRDEKTKYPGMTYEQGAHDALLWVLGMIENHEFAPARRKKGD